MSLQGRSAGEGRRAAHRAAATQPFFLDRADRVDGAEGRRLCVLHRPADADPVTALVVHAAPLGEEMNKSRRMVALQARTLARQGMACLVVDLAGCGDSSGSLLQARVADWVADLQAAADWLVARFGSDLPLWFWGLRSGALWAAAAAGARPGPGRLLLWAPQWSGRPLVQHWLRLGAAAGLAQGGGRVDTSGLKAARAAGQVLEIAGYPLTPALLDDLEALQMPPLPAGSVVRCLELAPQPGAEPSPVALKQIAQWAEAGIDARLEVVTGPAFWQTTEIEVAPALIEATARGLQPELARA